jgi:photosynthetic reaction center H subunit
MGTGAITAYVDVAQLLLYAFWIFFAGLIYYLVRENHREGYPLDNDRGLRIEGWPRVLDGKTYALDNGTSVVLPRPGDGPPESLQADRLYRGAGSPIEPNGNPLLAGVGPGAWSDQRPDVVDLDHHGQPKIVPLASAPEFHVSDKDPDPRGMKVCDAHGNEAGVVRDLWLDRGEMLFRYLDVVVPMPDRQQRHVLVPMPFARVTRQGVVVHAILASQYADAPAPQAADRLTLLEEERIAAYFGAGTLYAEPSRAEAWI